MQRALAVTICLATANALAQQPAPPAAPAPEIAPAPAPPATEGEPLAGYNGSFFLRDPNDWFVLFPKGRMQIDWYNFLNDLEAPKDPVTNLPLTNSADDKRPKSTLFIRRARVELQGTIFKHFDFSLAGEFATVPATGSYGAVTDAFVVVDYMPWAKLQVGQYDAPFTLENRTSDKYFDFMERSLAVRAFSVPQNKEAGAMLWGYAPNKLFYYSVGLFNGDGLNFKNQDNAPAVLGRGFVAPLVLWPAHRPWMADVWLGGSFWWQKAVNLGGPATPSASAATQNDLAAMSTQGGFGFFSSSYGNGKDAMGNAVRSHLTPDGEITKAALELNVPVNRFGGRFELVWQKMGLAQYNDTSATSKRLAPAAFGQLEGIGWYLELFAWVLGDTSFIETPGLELMPHVKKWAPQKEPKWGLMVAAKVEHLDFDVKSLAPPGGVALAAGDPAVGNYTVDALELGVNGWATKHIRLTFNYVANFIGGFEGKSTTDAKNLTTNLFYGKIDHELLFRIGVNL
jgi:hypothetical protein